MPRVDSEKMKACGRGSKIGGARAKQTKKGCVLQELLIGQDDELFASVFFDELRVEAHCGFGESNFTPDGRESSPVVASWMDCLCTFRAFSSPSH